MSKSLGNAIGITEPPNAMFGKVMSLADDLMIPYFEYCTLVPLATVREIEADLSAGRAHPRDIKKRLSWEITARYHGEAAARQAEGEFERVFGSRMLPQEIPEVALSRDVVQGGRVRLVRLLVALGLAASSAAARRLIGQGGVSLDRTRVLEDLDVPVRDGMLVQVGRRHFARVRLSG